MFWNPWRPQCKPALLLEVLREQSGHFHHVDGVFAEDFGELGVGEDEAFVFGVLELVGFDVVPKFFGGFHAGKFGSADDGGKFRGELLSWLVALGGFFGFFGGGRFFGGRFFFGAFFCFLAPAAFGFFDVGRFGVVGIFSGEVFEAVGDDVAVGVVGAGEEGFAEAGFAGAESTIAADGGARGHVFREGFPFFRDVDDPFAVGVFGAAEEGAESTKAEQHGAFANGAGLVVVEMVGVVCFVEGERF